MDNKKVKIIRENEKVIGLEFDGLKFEKNGNENITEFINRAKKEIEETKKINFHDYFKKENIIEEQKQLQEKINKQVEKPEVKKIKAKKEASKSLKKKIAAAVLIAALALGVGCVAHNLNSETKIEQTIDDLENKSVDELIAMLEQGKQQEAFNKIVDTQNYFNNTASLQVKKPEDNNAQLFLYFDEVQATYMYLNAKAMDSETLSKIFGKSKIMLMNKETGVYEEITQEGLSEKNRSAMQTLKYYYTRAKETSGISSLFENEKEKEFFEEFENLVLEYNKTKGSTEANKIREKLDEIYLSGEVDALFNKYPGATSIIATSIVPYLCMEDIISEQKNNSIIEINENITCEDIYNQIELVISKQKENGKEDIIEKIVKLQDEKLKDKNRSINMQNSLEGYTLEDLEKASTNITPSFKENKKIQETVTESKKEAIDKTSEQQVEKAEQEGNKELEDKNQAQNTYWNDYSTGYAEGYDKTWAALQKNSSKPNIPSNKSKGYIDGFKAGIKYATSDYEQAKKDQAEYDKNNQEVIEKPIDSEYVKPSQKTEEDTIIKEELNNDSDTWTEFIDSTYYPEPKTVTGVLRDGTQYTSTITEQEQKTKTRGALV